MGGGNVGADDVELLRRLAAGDLSALEPLYDRYKSVAYAIGLRITSDPALAEDVVQDAFLGAWRNAGRYADDRGSARTWLLSIVHHRAIDAIRRRRVSAALPEGEEQLPSSMTLPDVWPEVAGRLDTEIVRSALGRLSSVQRETLELAYWDGLTQQEIAAQMSAPLGTVKSRMRLGLLALRRDLLGEGPGGPGDRIASAGREIVAPSPTQGEDGLVRSVAVRLACAVGHAAASFVRRVAGDPAGVRPAIAGSGRGSAEATAESVR